MYGLYMHDHDLCVCLCVCVYMYYTVGMHQIASIIVYVAFGAKYYNMRRAAASQGF